MKIVAGMKLWFERLWFAQHNVRVLADMEWRMVLLVENATGGRMSKAYYSTDQMNVEVAANHTALYQEGYDEGVAQCDCIMSDVARCLIDQEAEPFPEGTETDRLHYWRDKAITAADTIRLHIAEHSDGSIDEDVPDAAEEPEEIAPPIEQRDREAAARMVEADQFAVACNIRAGHMDGYRIVKAFAQHRIDCARDALLDPENARG